MELTKSAKKLLHSQSLRWSPAKIGPRSSKADRKRVSQNVQGADPRQRSWCLAGNVSHPAAPTLRRQQIEEFGADSCAMISVAISLSLASPLRWNQGTTHVTHLYGPQSDAVFTPWAKRKLDCNHAESLGSIWIYSISMAVWHGTISAQFGKAHSKTYTKGKKKKKKKNDVSLWHVVMQSCSTIPQSSRCLLAFVRAKSPCKQGARAGVIVHRSDGIGARNTTSTEEALSVCPPFRREQKTLHPFGHEV